MTEAERIAAEAKAKADAEAKARADAEAGEKLDKLLTGIDSIHKRLDASDKRMDAMEENFKDAKRKDDDDDDDEEEEPGKSKEEPKQVAADKKKRKDDDDDDSLPEAKMDKKGKRKDDAKRKDEKSEQEEMAERMKANEKKKDDDDDEGDDSKRKDSRDDAELTKLRADLIELRSRMPLDQAHPDYNALLDAQAKADDVFRAFGDSAPRPLNGEGLLAYRNRLAAKLKSHSSKWKDVDLSKLPEPAFNIAQDAIYADAMEAAKNPLAVADGDLRVIPGKTQAGHAMNSFVGRPSAWMNEFSGQRRGVQDIITRPAIN